MALTLRPHHLLDILRDHGYGIRYEPHEYGHALHLIAGRVTDDPDLEAEFVAAADDICRPCRNLLADGTCLDGMQKDGETFSKQAYNDNLDRRLFSYLGLHPGDRMTVRFFLQRVRERLDGLERVCAHPGEDPAYRKKGLQEGLAKMGID